MARTDQSGDEPRTEAPTARRLRHARERGDAPRSPLAAGAAVLLGVSAAIALGAGGAIEALRGYAADVWSLGAALDPTRALERGLAVGAGIAAPVLAVAVGLGALASALIAGPGWSPGAIAPDLGRLDPARGLRERVSGRGLLERVSGLALVVTVGAAGISVLLAALPGLLGRADLGPEALLGASGRVLGALAWRLGAVLAIAGALAAVYRRWRWRTDQRMSRRELRRELRETEGEPTAKRRRVERHRERAMAAPLEEAIAGATLVVRGPGVAVAIAWPAREAAPEIARVARGLEAERLRWLSRAVPTVRDPGLAEALARVRPGATVPRLLWRRVAGHLARTAA